MTIQRMNDLLTVLEEQGWRRLDVTEFSNASSDPYKLEDEMIVWGVARGDSDLVLELHFVAFDGLGRRTKNLRDLSYCCLRDTDVMLMFDKRSSHDWLPSVRRFVHELDGRVESRKPRGK
jgi:hypothetical protein